MASPDKVFIYDPKTGTARPATGDEAGKLEDGSFAISCREPIRNVLARHDAEIASLLARIEALEGRK